MVAVMFHVAFSNVKWLAFPGGTHGGALLFLPFLCVFSWQQLDRAVIETREATKLTARATYEEEDSCLSRPSPVAYSCSVGVGRGVGTDRCGCLVGEHMSPVIRRRGEKGERPT
jgi:hypothetical protein